MHNSVVAFKNPFYHIDSALDMFAAIVNAIDAK